MNSWTLQNTKIPFKKKSLYISSKVCKVLPETKH